MPGKRRFWNGRRNAHQNKMQAEPSTTFNSGGDENEQLGAQVLRERAESLRTRTDYLNSCIDYAKAEARAIAAKKMNLQALEELRLAEDLVRADIRLNEAKRDRIISQRELDAVTAPYGILSNVVEYFSKNADYMNIFGDCIRRTSEVMQRDLNAAAGATPRPSAPSAEKM